MKYNKIKKRGNVQYICIIIGIALYMIAYLCVFIPFNARGVYDDSVYFESVVSIALVEIGIGFTCANISYFATRFRNKYMRGIVILCSTILQLFCICEIISSFYGKAIADASYHFSQDGIDFSRRILVASIIIGVYLLVQFVYTVMLMIRDRHYNEINDYKRESTKKAHINVILRIINSSMAIALLAINIMLFYYLEETRSGAMSVFEEMKFSYFWSRLLFDVLAVGLPFLLVFVGVVDRCIKSKRYILTAIIYGASVVAIANAMYFLYYETFEYRGINEYRIFEGYNMILMLLAGTYFLCGLWNKIVDYFNN